MKKVKRLFLVLILETLFLLIYTVLYPNIEVITDPIDVGTNYLPSTRAFNIFGHINNKVTCSNEVNTSVLGDYQITCQVKYLFYHSKKKIAVKVVDRESPTITLEGQNPASACPNKNYEEEGYTALDNYDKDITSNVVINQIDDNIIYVVEDSSGNKASANRKIIYEDKEPPSLELYGNTSITIFLGDTYNEKGYKATDNCDDDITDKVVVTGTVDTRKIGSYKLTYEVSDLAGNKTVQERTIYVRKKEYSYGNGNIYLTFDDGPSYLTSRILDILDSEGVKATFFVTGADSNTKRAYESGHTIALHTNSHNYSYIYSSSDNYFNDLNAISDKVNNVIGVRPTIIRFPGGSSNTISRNYQKGIMSYLTNEVLNRGYTYYDWNVDSNDAGGDIYNSSKIYSNVINNLSHSRTNIVLMHDIGGHEATVNALRDIIKFGKEYGYTFKAITSDTPVVRHGVNN